MPSVSRRRSRRSARDPCREQGPRCGTRDCRAGHGPLPAGALPATRPVPARRRRAADPRSSRRVRVSDVEISSISAFTSARSSLYVAITFQSIALSRLRPGGRSTGVTTARGCVPGYRPPVSPRTRMTAIVGVVAALAGGAVVAITALSDDGPATAARASAPSQRPGLRRSRSISASATDREAVDLRRALLLYERGHARRRPRCSGGTTRSRRGWDGLHRVAGRHRQPAHPARRPPSEEPRRPAQPRHRPLLVGAGGQQAGVAGSRRCRARHELRGRCRQPALPGLRAEAADLRPCRAAPRGARRLQAHPDRQLRLLERGAHGRHRARTPCFYGVALQSLGRQLSAERVYARAARRRRTMRKRRWRRPSDASTRLSPQPPFPPWAADAPLSAGRHGAIPPRVAAAWSGQVKDARHQLRLARTVEPGQRRRERPSATSTGWPPRDLNTTGPAQFFDVGLP